MPSLQVRPHPFLPEQGPLRKRKFHLTINRALSKFIELDFERTGRKSRKNNSHIHCESHCQSLGRYIHERSQHYRGHPAIDVSASTNISKRRPDIS